MQLNKYKPHLNVNFENYFVFLNQHRNNVHVTDSYVIIFGVLHSYNTKQDQ